MHTPIKVLIVDDSAFIRVLLTKIFESDKDISVVATAEHPLDAREKIKKYSPDVITLDVEMPKMDGLTFLRNLMRLRPMPVVMVSTLTQAGADVTIQALDLGAFDFVAKPASDVKQNISLLSEQLISKVKAAAKCNLSALDKFSDKPLSDDKINLKPKTSQTKALIDLIAIGASTGGTEAIQQVLRHLPANLPPIVLAQHIPDVFSTSYAKRLDKTLDLNVIEVRESQPLEYGKAYLAPGHMHMKVQRKSQQLWACLSDQPAVNRHKPAVDVLFDSVAETVGARAIGVLLTGMGHDGAKGMLNLKNAGAVTIAQDEASSIVWGMPGTAVKLNAVNEILALNDIAEFLLSRIYTRYP